MERDDGPSPAEVGPAPVRRPRRWPRTLRYAAAVLVLFLGPWPADNRTYQGSDYQRRTLARLEAPGAVSAGAGPIRVGVAERDITPRPGLPLAGFAKQARKSFVAVDTPCFARALTVESAAGTTTILTADLLLINDALARAVLARTGLRPEQVYFTASHTHCGPGGWGAHPLEELVAGRYDPAYFDALADQLAAVVTRSRAHAEPAELAVVTVRTHDRQKNRVAPGAPTHDPLTALVFRPASAGEGGPPLAILVVFGAHATVFGTDPPCLSSDYPGALAAHLKQKTGAGAVLFAAGAVGDASPVRPRLRLPSERARALGEGLAEDLLPALPSARFERRPECANVYLDVDLPPLRLPVGGRFRFSPLSTSWIGDSKTHLHVLRLGPAVLAGMPGDFAGGLAEPLSRWAEARGLMLVATSFNGDYKGYFVSRDVFRERGCYETRWMNFFGPWAGEYLSDLARRAIEASLVRDPRARYNGMAGREGDAAGPVSWTVSHGPSSAITAASRNSPRR